MIDDGHWLAVSDKDPRAVGLYLRHYSSVANRQLPRQRAAKLAGREGGIVGGGQRIVLMTVDCLALWVWKRYPDGLNRNGSQHGVVCSVFRNEGPILSSDLIKEADLLADWRWPGERHYTYVNPGKIRKKRDPGRCFIRAGWRNAGTNGDGKLLVLERLPS